MCSVAEDGAEDGAISKPERPTKLPKDCVKCQQRAMHVVGTNGTFCSDCFDKHVSHKFRASMGKNPIVRNGDRVLIAFSGGISSSALLHLVTQGLLPTAQRKLKFTPGVIFVDERSVTSHEHYDVTVKDIEDIMTRSGFPYYVVKLEEVFVSGEESAEAMKNAEEKLTSLLQSTRSLTTKLELVYRLRCQLLSHKALCLDYKHVFLAETSTRLAIKILSNVAQGRGAHMSQDTGFTDGDRFAGCGVNLLRPIRDLSSKEIAMYNAIHKVRTVFLPNLTTKESPSSSIPSLTENFVQGLVRNFPSTEMTVYRISNKIRPATGKKLNKAGEIDSIRPMSLRCRFCLGNLDNVADERGGASAREDLSHSEAFKKMAASFNGDCGEEISTEIASEPTHKDLCYPCSILMKDVKETDLTFLDNLPTAPPTESNRHNLLSQLQGVLIDDSN